MARQSELEKRNEATGDADGESCLHSLGPCLKTTKTKYLEEHFMLRKTDRGVRVHCNANFTWFELAKALPSIASFGFNVIYLNPIMESDGSEHGYSIADPTLLSTFCGGLAGWTELVSGFKQFGFKVIIDTAHHVWEKASPGVLALTEPDSRYLDFGSMKRVRLEDPAIAQRWLGFEFGLLNELESSGIGTSIRLDFAAGVYDLPGLANFVSEEVPNTTFLIENTRRRGDAPYTQGIQGDTGQWWANAFAKAISRGDGQRLLNKKYGIYTGQEVEFSSVLAAALKVHLYTFDQEITKLHLMALRTEPSLTKEVLISSLLAGNIELLPSIARSGSGFCAEWRLVHVKIATKGWVTATHRHTANFAFNEGELSPNEPSISMDDYFELLDWHFEHTPLGLLDPYTHDNYNSADARAFALALTYHAAEFVDLIDRLTPVFERLAPNVSSRILWTIMVTLVRSPTISLKRVVAYLVKWARETADVSFWQWEARGWVTKVDVEEAMQKAVSALWVSPEFRKPFDAFLGKLSETGRWIALTQQFALMLSGGIGINYNLTTNWDFHLEDPDNRFEPDVQAFAQLLKTVRGGGDPVVGNFKLGVAIDDTTKASLIFQALQISRQYPYSFGCKPKRITDVPEGVCAWAMGDGRQRVEMYCAFTLNAIPLLPQPTMLQRSQLPFFRQFGMDVLTPKH
jgi:maltooligosyltrehalose synthase